VEKNEKANKQYCQEALFRLVFKLFCG